ncbi:hypothetical protein SEVIR_2G069100v4 [Setaria viridis]|uniref:F-box domain-containing protein n=1 Tax=Setaria viridis TaxID=4556 RepID=A0A4U6VPS1_SETVI|nr:F-box protein At5g07610-like [Setaria viridis]TKW30905.1 hypothetical protein SEVIR_2G069100v2 [Setaria viridis]
MERPKKSGAVAGLPDDPLVEVLSRVPAKDLHRSKCVSKGWRDLIADPLHRKKLPRTLQGFFHAWDFINLLGGSRPPVDPSFAFLKKLPGIGNICLRDSCNGLLLFRHFTSGTISYVVCNPATEQWAAVPSEHTPADYHMRVRNTYLVFDPAVSSHFQLVTICAEEGSLATVHIYSSKTGVWKHSQTDWAEEEKQLGLWKGPNPQINGRVRGAPFFNGLLYVMLNNYQIAKVDVEGKTRGIIPAPSSMNSLGAYYGPPFIGQSQGHLYCIHEPPSQVYTRDSNDGRDLLSIWVLDYDTQKWALKHRVSRTHLFGSRFYTSDCDYNVVAIHPDSNMVFIFLNWKRQLISYSLDSKEVHALGTLEQDPGWFVPYVPCFLDFLSVVEHEEKLKGPGEQSAEDVARVGGGGQ